MFATLRSLMPTITTRRSRTNGTVYLPTFHDAFSWASDRRLHMLYDTVADDLDSGFRRLRQGAEEQLEVLDELAAALGLDASEAAEQLSREDERTALRIAWRTAARWTVLSLLFTLEERRDDEPCSIREWVAAVPIEERTQLLGSGDLPEADKPVALVLAAEALLRCFAERDAALLIRDRPLLLRADATSIRAAQVSPLALVATRSEPTADALPLSEGDRVWSAPGEPELVVDARYDAEADSMWTIDGDGELRVEEGHACVPVVQGVALYASGMPLKTVVGSPTGEKPALASYQR